MSEKVVLKDKTFKMYLPGEKIQEAVRKIGNKLSEDYAGQNPLFLCILSGSFMFAADLLKQIKGDCEITFVRLSSYSGTESTGKLSTLIGIQKPLEGRHVVIIEDIVDTGHTLSKFLPQVREFQPASLKVVSLLVKPEALQGKVEVDYRGFDIPNDFIVGYGLDYDELGRNLPDIYVLDI